MKKYVGGGAEVMAGEQGPISVCLNGRGQTLFLAENSEILISAIYLVWKGHFFVC